MARRTWRATVSPPAGGLGELKGRAWTACSALGMRLRKILDGPPRRKIMPSRTGKTAPAEVRHSTAPTISAEIKDVIQVAGVIDQAEAKLLVKSGVRYLGFPLRLPIHPEDLSEQAASRIIRSLRPPTRAVLITYLNHAGDIVEFCHSLGASVVQLHGDIEAA